MEYEYAMEKYRKKAFYGNNPNVFNFNIFEIIIFYIGNHRYLVRETVVNIISTAICVDLALVSAMTKASFLNYVLYNRNS